MLKRVKNFICKIADIDLNELDTLFVTKTLSEPQLVIY